MTRTYSRRSWLRNVGLGAGAALVAPFLHRVALADHGPVTRFLFLVEGNGFEPVTMLGDASRAAIDPTLASPIGAQRWWARGYRHEAMVVVDGDLPTAPALGPLTGFHDRAAVLFGLSSKITGGGHSAFHGALASARTVAKAPGGPTIDAWLSAQPSVRGQTPFDAVRLGVGGNTGRALDFGTCAYGAGDAAPLILQPDAAFKALFGYVSDDPRAFRRRGAQLDFAVADVRAALDAFSGNSRERAKLEAYLASIESLQQRRARLLDIADEVRGVAPSAPDVQNISHLGRLELQLQLAAASLLGGLTNVAVVGSGTGSDFGITYPEILRGVGRHDLHHGSAGNPAYRDAIHAATRRQVGMLADVARTLDAVPEGDGTALDHTVIVYVGDNGEQHHSQATEFPVLLLGGGKVGLRTGGRTLVFPGQAAGGAHRQLSNLWNTLGHVAGQDLNRFGAEGPTRIAAGPLGELLA